MNRWQSAATGVGAVLLIALLRSGAQFLRWHDEYSLWAFLVGNLAVAAIWLPIGIAVDRIWRTVKPGRTRQAALAAIGLVVLFVEPWWTFRAMAAAGIPFAPYVPLLLGRIDTNVVFYLVVVGGTRVAVRRRQHAAHVHAAAELRAQVSGTELHVLTLQLHPHFLFNTLNLISQLAFTEPGAARRVIHALRELVSRSLACGSRTLVPMREEWRLLESYVDIQRLRWRDRLRVDLTLDPHAASASVPNLLLQPLVENAILHGIAPRRTGGHISVVVARIQDRVRIEIRDDGRGVPSRSTEGRGLANTRLRLDRAFGDSATLTIDRHVTGGTVVRLDIPYEAWKPAEDSLPASPASGMPLYEETHERRLRPSIVVLAWVLVGAVWSRLVLAGSGATHYGITDLEALLSCIASAAIWALLTPVAITLARRFDVGQRAPIRMLALHAVIGAVVATVHVIAWYGFLFVTMRAAFDWQRPNYFAWWMWDVGAYAMIVAFTTVAALGRRTVDQRVAIARQRAMLAEMRTTALRLRLQPGLLMRGLDAIEYWIGRDSEQAERAIARFGDLLRGLLAATTDDVVDAKDELDVVTAFYGVIALADAAQPRHSGVARGRVPAMVAAPFLATLGGVVMSLDSASDEHGLLLEAQACGAVDTGALGELSTRVASLTKGHGRITIRERSPDGIVAQLWVPWLPATAA